MNSGTRVYWCAAAILLIALAAMFVWKGAGPNRLVDEGEAIVECSGGQASPSIAMALDENATGRAESVGGSGTSADGLTRKESAVIRPRLHGRVVSSWASPIAGASVSYLGEQTETDSQGRFSFEEFVWGATIEIAKEGSGHLFSRTMQTEGDFEILSTESARIDVVRDYGTTEVEDGAIVRVFLLEGLSSVRSVWRENLRLIAEQAVDSSGSVIFRGLPSVPRDGFGPSYLCEVEFSDGLRMERRLMPKGGSPTHRYQSVFRRTLLAPPSLDLVVQKSGASTPLASANLAYRVSTTMGSPWHKTSTDRFGGAVLPFVEWGGLQLIASIPNGSQWVAMEGDLLDSGSGYLGVVTGDLGRLEVALDMEAPLPAGVELRSEITVSSVSGISPGPPSNGIESVGVPVRGSIAVVSPPMKVVGTHACLAIVAYPGGAEIVRSRLVDLGRKGLAIPPLSNVTVQIPRALSGSDDCAIWFTPLDSSASAFVFSLTRQRTSVVLPQGKYKVILIARGITRHEIGEIAITGGSQEISVNPEPTDATIEFNFIGVDRLGFPVSFRLDSASVVERPEGDPQFKVQGVPGQRFIGVLTHSFSASEEIELISGSSIDICLDQSFDLIFDAPQIRAEIAFGELRLKSDGLQAEHEVRLRRIGPELSSLVKLRLVRNSTSPGGFEFGIRLPEGKYEWREGDGKWVEVDISRRAVTEQQLERSVAGTGGY